MKHCLKITTSPQRAEINGELCKRDSKQDPPPFFNLKKFNYVPKTIKKLKGK